MPYNMSPQAFAAIALQTLLLAQLSHPSLCAQQASRDHAFIGYSEKEHAAGAAVPCEDKERWACLSQACLTLELHARGIRQIDDILTPKQSVPVAVQWMRRLEGCKGVCFEPGIYETDLRALVRNLQGVCHQGEQPCTPACMCVDLD